MSEPPPFGEISSNRANISPGSPRILGSSDVKSSPNNVTKVNGEHVEVTPKVSPCAFKNGPEVPRTIYPGLDDFLPECDGELLF